MPLRFSTLYRKTKPPVEISLILGWGEPTKKWKGNFWVLPRASLSSAAEAQVSFVKILRILSKIHSNFVQYTPPKLKIGIGSRNGVAPQARHKRIPAKNSRIQKVFPRSAWLKKDGSILNLKVRTDFFVQMKFLFICTLVCQFHIVFQKLFGKFEPIIRFLLKSR